MKIAEALIAVLITIIIFLSVTSLVHQANHRLFHYYLAILIAKKKYITHNLKKKKSKTEMFRGCKECC